MNNPYAGETQCLEEVALEDLTGWMPDLAQGATLHDLFAYTRNEQVYLGGVVGWGVFGVDPTSGVIDSCLLQDGISRAVGRKRLYATFADDTLTVVGPQDYAEHGCVDVDALGDLGWTKTYESDITGLDIVDITSRDMEDNWIAIIGKNEVNAVHATRTNQGLTIAPDPPRCWATRSGVGIGIGDVDGDEEVDLILSSRAHGLQLGRDVENLAASQDCTDSMTADLTIDDAHPDLGRFVDIRDGAVALATDASIWLADADLAVTGPADIDTSAIADLLLAPDGLVIVHTDGAVTRYTETGVRRLSGDTPVRAAVVLDEVVWLGLEDGSLVAW